MSDQHDCTARKRRFLTLRTWLLSSESTVVGLQFRRCPNDVSQHSRDVSTFDGDTTTELVPLIVVELHIAPEAGTAKKTPRSGVSRVQRNIGEYSNNIYIVFMRIYVYQDGIYILDARVERITETAYYVVLICCRAG